MRIGTTKLLESQKAFVMTAWRDPLIHYYPSGTNVSHAKKPQGGPPGWDAAQADAETRAFSASRPPMMLRRAVWMLIAVAALVGVARTMVAVIP